VSAHLITTPTAFRSIRRITQPEVEPVSVSEAKAQLGISPDVSEHDAVLSGLISAARIAAESRLNMSLMATQWQAVHAGFWGCGCHGVELPYPPLLVNTEHPVGVRWKDRDGLTHVVEAADIEVNTDEFPGRLYVRASMAAGACCDGAAVVTWWAGVLSPADVPSPIRTAMLRMVARMFGDRGDTAENILEADHAVAHLLAACSWAGRY